MSLKNSLPCFFLLRGYLDWSVPPKKTSECLLGSRSDISTIWPTAGDSIISPVNLNEQPTPAFSNWSYPAISLPTTIYEETTRYAEPKSLEERNLQVNLTLVSSCRDWIYRNEGAPTTMAIQLQVSPAKFQLLNHRSRKQSRIDHLLVCE